MSRHIEDRRGVSGGGFPLGKAAGIGGIPAILIMLALAFFGGGLPGGGGGGGFDINDVLTQLPAAAPASGDAPATGEFGEQEQFVSFVIDDIHAFWDAQYAAAGEEYAAAPLVLFSGQVNSACGFASAASGPFYCPPDQRVYIDLEFFEELSQRFGAPGDFAQAYVIAHEVGHHVQTLTGVSTDVRRAAQENPDQANELSVRQELQADCLAGVWAHSVYTRDLLDTGDIEEGLNAASAVGDDRIQREMGSGRVNPETWTHGSSEQRSRWFQSGFESGDPSDCDTFSGDI
jgi:predicted metalloprotease